MTKRNYFSKIVAVLMAVLLAFGTLSITAFAEITPTPKGSIKVDGIADTDASTATVTAYQLMTVDVDTATNTPKDPTYYWVPAVAEYLKNAGEPLSTYVANDSNAVTEAFSKTQAGDLASFYDIIANQIKNGSLKDSVTAAATRTGNCTLSNLDMGNYLVLIDGATKVYRPSSQNVVPTYENGEWSVKEVTIEVKSSDVNITKKIVVDGNKVDETNASIGDTITYELNSKVPTYPANAKSKNFAMSDTLSEGLTYDETTLKVYGVDKADSETLLTADTNYTVGNIRPNGNTKTTFTLDFIYETIKDYASIKVTYSAKLNEKAVYGDNANTANNNTAYVDYNNKPYDDVNWNSDTDNAKVYTYEMDLVKVDKKNAETKLAGAEFQITRDGSDTALRFYKIADGVYRLALDTETENVTTTIASAEGGKLNVSGLGADKYILTETKAPDGYNLPSKSFEFTLTASTDAAGTVILDNNEATASATGVVTKNIQNSNGFTLPTTGGMGTVLFTVAGVALVALGVVMIVVLKKKNSKAAE